MIATRTIWRYTKDSYPYQTRCADPACGHEEDHFLNDSVKETIQPGERCDWAKGSVYESLGWAIPAV